MDILKQQEERDEEKRWDVLNKIFLDKKLNYHDKVYKNDVIKNTLYNKAVDENLTHIFTFELNTGTITTTEFDKIHTYFDIDTVLFENLIEPYQKIFNYKNKTFMIKPHGYMLLKAYKPTAIHIKGVFDNSYEILLKNKLVKKAIIIYDVKIKNKKNNRPKKKNRSIIENDDDIFNELRKPDTPTESDDETIQPELLDDIETIQPKLLDGIETIQPELLDDTEIIQPDTSIEIYYNFNEIIKIIFNKNIFFGTVQYENIEVYEKKYIVTLLNKLHKNNSNFQQLTKQYDKIMIWSNIHFDKSKITQSKHFTASFLYMEGERDIKTPHFHFYIADDEIITITRIINLI